MKEDKLIYNKFLVLFMKGKAKQIKKYGCDIKYFNKKIENNIMKWPPESAKYIYITIKKTFASGLNLTTCPYCYYTKTNCDICYYAFVMEKCEKNESNWKKIFNYFYNQGKAYAVIGGPEKYIRTILSNQFYEDLINRIEKKLKIKQLKVKPSDKLSGKTYDNIYIDDMENYKIK